jgi:hypothetical protein
MKKAKKLLAFLIIIIFLLIDSGCNSVSSLAQGGKTATAEVSIGKSNQFSEEEIKDAMSCVKKRFKVFYGCTLTKLWYDEEKSSSYAEGFLTNDVEADNVIVLFSDFDVGSSCDEGLTPNSTYTDWSWILIRDSKTGDWRVDNWGY